MRKDFNYIYFGIQSVLFLSLLGFMPIVASGAHEVGDSSFKKKLIRESTKENIGEAFCIEAKYYNTLGQKQPIGSVRYGSYFPDTKEGSIWELRVKKKHRSQGYGSYMLRQAMKHLKELGFTKVKLDAMPSDVAFGSALKRFYARHRFEHVKGHEMVADLTVFDL